VATQLVAEKLHAEPHPGLFRSINSEQDASLAKEFVSGMQDGKGRSLFRNGTGSDAAAFLTAIPTAAVTSKRTDKEFSMYAADNARFRIQCKLRFRYRPRTRLQAPEGRSRHLTQRCPRRHTRCCFLRETLDHAVRSPHALHRCSTQPEA